MESEHEGTLKSAGSRITLSQKESTKGERSQKVFNAPPVIALQIKCKVIMHNNIPYSALTNPYNSTILLTITDISATKTPSGHGIRSIPREVSTGHSCNALETDAVLYHHTRRKLPPFQDLAIRQSYTSPPLTGAVLPQMSCSPEKAKQGFK